MENCVFCKIAGGEIPSAKIWEDELFLAFLDINPNTRGMALLIPKKHFESDIFSISDDFYSKLMIASKKVANLLEKSLNVKRVALVAEGMGVNHAHLKLYPLHGLEDKFKEIWAREKVFFENYPGYLTTQLGPEADISKLKKLAEKIKSAG